MKKLIIPILLSLYISIDASAQNAQLNINLVKDSVISTKIYDVVDTFYFEIKVYTGYFEYQKNNGDSVFVDRVTTWTEEFDKVMARKKFIQSLHDVFLASRDNINQKLDDAIIRKDANLSRIDYLRSKKDEINRGRLKFLDLLSQ